jgi:hypothetical protein
VRSLLIVGASAAIFLFVLVRNDRAAREDVRAEDAAVGRLLALVGKPPGPPFVEGGYRFEWIGGGELPPLVLAYPAGKGASLLAASADGSVYTFELFDDPPPDVTPLRIRLARDGENLPIPSGWRKVR